METAPNADSVAQRARTAKQIAPALASSSLARRNELLLRIHGALRDRREDIMRANQGDLASAEEDNLAAPLLKRLRFQDAQIDAVCLAIKSLVSLADPLGQICEERLLDTGLKLSRYTVPIGSIGVVFESRPDALVQIASLCLKSGNCCLMKGGREAERTNALLAKIIVDATADFHGWLALLETRDEVDALIQCSESVDLIVPRGSNEFVRSIIERSTIPVMGHADGVCHVYIDSEADLDMAEQITIDAKTQYPAVCNALECLLIHEQVAETLLPKIAASLRERNVTLYGCAKSQAIFADILPASEAHWGREFLSLELAVRIVPSLDDAIAHIHRYGSKHTDAIVTANDEHAQRFLKTVDSSSVLWNCSTRFSDGYRYGLGAEVGIATGKMHARGPVGLSGLTTYKWILVGQGHVVADYSGKNAKSFLHQS